MTRPDLIAYIKEQRQRGRSDDIIKNALISAGWQAQDIENAIKLADSNTPIAPLPSSSSYSGQPDQIAGMLPSPTDLLKEAWGIYKARFKTFIGIAVIPAISIVILAGLLLIIMLLSGKNLMDTTGFFLVFGIAIFVIFIPVIILQFWSQGAMLFAVKDSEENIGIRESYRRGWHKIGSIFWVGLLSGIIVFGGSLLFVIPGIIFSVWFSLAAMIVVAEGLGGMNALLKSKSYVSGYWWEVFWRFLFIGLILFGINLIFGIPAGIINFVAELTKSASLSIIGMIISFVGNIIGFLLAPLAVVYTFLVYKNLKAIKRDFVFAPSSGEKIKFIIVGLLGILLFFGFIIGSIVLVSLNSARDKAMDAARRSEISAIEPALIIYHDDNNTYPESLSQLVPKYYYKIPVDPKTKLPYEYRQLEDGKDYELCANFDIGGRKCFNGYNLDNDQTSDTAVKKRNQYYADIGEIKNLWGAGRYQESLDRANKILPDAETDEDKAIVHYWIGLSQYKLKNFDEAEKEELLAINLDNKYAAPYVTLAAIEMDNKNNPSKALEYAAKCIELDSQYAWCYNSKGSALFLLGQKEEGIKAFEQAVSLAPDSYVFRDNLTRAKQAQ